MKVGDVCLFCGVEVHRWNSYEGIIHMLCKIIWRNLILDNKYTLSYSQHGQNIVATMLVTCWTTSGDLTQGKVREFRSNSSSIIHLKNDVSGLQVGVKDADQGGSFKTGDGLMLQWFVLVNGWGKKMVVPWRNAFGSICASTPYTSMMYVNPCTGLIRPLGGSTNRMLKFIDSPFGVASRYA